MSNSDLLLKRANQSLRSAELLSKEGDTEAAASRVYYACFYTAQALLANLGLKFARHGQVIAQFGFHFSKTQLLDPRFHKLLSETFELRWMADYQVEVSVDPEVVSGLIPECREFITAASRYLEGLEKTSSEGSEGET